MKQVYIISRYIDSNYFGRGISGYIESVFRKLNINYKIIDEEEKKKIKNSIVFILGHFPSCYGFDKSNDLFLWNLEPIAIKKEQLEHRKMKRRFDYGEEIFKNNYIKGFLTYDLKQIDFYKNKKSNIFIDYLPTGFDDFVVPKISVEKNIDTLLFAGNLGKKGEFRRNFIKKLMNNVKVSVLNNSKNNDDFLKEISRFSMGLVFPDTKFNDAIPWYRILLFSSNNIIMFSGFDLSEIGFENKKNYFKFSNFDELVLLVNNFVNMPIENYKSMQFSAKNNIIKNFTMTNLIKNTEFYKYLCSF